MRDDALLVVVVITDEWDGMGDPEDIGGQREPATSLGTPQSWHDDVVAAKGGLAQNVAALAITNYADGPCPPLDSGHDGVNIVDWVELFGDHGDKTLDDWIQRQKNKWNPFDRTNTVALFSVPDIFDSGNEPPLLAALRRVYREQTTTSDCSITSVMLLLQALLEEGAPDTPEGVQALVDDKGAWLKATEKGGPGVTFAELVRYATAAFGRHGFKVSAVQPSGDRESEMRFREHLQALGSTEHSRNSALLLYVDQGVFCGVEESFLHVTPVGAYHPDSDGVLIVEVDGELPSLYLSPVGDVMKAMQRPGDERQGALCGERGGWLWIEPA